MESPCGGDVVIWQASMFLICSLITTLKAPNCCGSLLARQNELVWCDLGVGLVALAEFVQQTTFPVVIGTRETRYDAKLDKLPDDYC